MIRLCPLRHVPLLALLVLALPSAALARDDLGELPRRKPRITSPGDDEMFDAPAKKKRTRRHAAPIEEDEYEPVEVIDEPPPVRRHVLEDEEQLPARSTGPSIRARELPERTDDGPELRSRTAEEELRDGDGMPKEERLALIDVPGNGFAVELVGGALMLDSPIGELLPAPTFAGGFHATWQLGRLFRPENDFLHRGLYIDVSYLYTWGSGGTRSINVDSSYHHLSAAALVGFPVGSEPLSVLFYAKVGPAIYLMPFTYSIEGVETDFTGVRGGFVYGAGVRGTYYFGPVGISARVELLRYRRSYLDDTMLGGGLGVAF